MSVLDGYGMFVNSQQMLVGPNNDQYLRELEKYRSMNGVSHGVNIGVIQGTQFLGSGPDPNLTLLLLEDV